ncbi:MAG: hypothetical protein JXR96_09350 [Deltaproteobacteria bacterium]|nr:hypothetical protein [Deltaproteobacteria bacterium]
MALLSALFSLVRLFGGFAALVVFYSQLNRYVFLKPGAHFADYLDVFSTNQTELLLAPLLALLAIAFELVHLLRKSKERKGTYLGYASLGLASLVMVLVILCEIPSIRHRMRIYSYWSGLAEIAPKSVDLEDILRRYPELVPELLDDPALRRTLIARGPDSILHGGQESSALTYAALRLDGRSNPAIWELASGNGEPYAWGAQLMVHMLMAEAQGAFPAELAARIAPGASERVGSFKLGYLSYAEERERLNRYCGQEDLGGLYIKQLIHLAMAHPGLIATDNATRLLGMWRDKRPEYSKAIDALIEGRRKLCVLGRAVAADQEIGLEVEIVDLGGLAIDARELASGIRSAVRDLLATCELRARPGPGLAIRAAVEMERFPGTRLTREQTREERVEKKRYDHYSERWVAERVWEKRTVREDFTGTLVAPVLRMRARAAGREESLSAPPTFSYLAPETDEVEVHALKHDPEYILPGVMDILLGSWQL